MHSANLERGRGSSQNRASCTAVRNGESTNSSAISGTMGSVMTPASRMRGCAAQYPLSSVAVVLVTAVHEMQSSYHIAIIQQSKSRPGKLPVYCRNIRRCAFLHVRELGNGIHLTHAGLGV